MKCPNCGCDLLLTVTTNDITGNSYTSFYRCESCETKLDEDEVVKFNDNEII